MRKLFILIPLLALICGTLHAQKVPVSGIVVDGEGNNIPGASVIIKGTTTGVATGADGRFSLQASGRDDILLISFIGYLPVETRAGTNLRVVMLPDAREMDAVVITGIFNKAKESYTGSAKTITEAELKRSGTRSLLTTISNIDPSFNIVTDLVAGSDPNALPDITMRGNSSMTTSVREVQNKTRDNNSNLPLFVMDGFEISLQRMLDLDQNQISSVVILKDAAATAMYGTRGANGVVVLTSKAPAEGRLRITYTGNFSIEAADLSSYDLMNAREKLEFENMAGLYTLRTGRDNQKLQELYYKRLLDVERGVDTYWLKFPVHNGLGNRHSVRVEGGGNSLRFNLGVSYDNVTGTMKGSERNTMNGNAFISYQFKNVTFQNDLQVAFNKSYNSLYGEFWRWAGLNSYFTPYDDQGNPVKVMENFTYYSVNAGEVSRVYSPLYDAMLPNKNESKYNTVRNNFAINWNILPELTVRGAFSIHHQDSRGDLYIPASHSQYADYEEKDWGRRGRYEMTVEESSGYEADITASFSKTFREKHQIYAGVRYRIAEDRYEGYQFQAEGISSPEFDFMGMASAYKKDASPQGWEGISRSHGGTANFNYTYDRRYFVDLTGTVEASSKFGADNRAAPFWSVSGGWNIHQENFMKEVKLLNQARMRLSYGTSGSQNFNPYMAYTTYKDYGDLTYNGWYAARIMALGNPDLGWQQTRQVNVGTELHFFESIVSVEFDYYRKMTDDLLSDITIPSAGGFKSYKANIGKVQNNGFEVYLNVYAIRNPERNIFWSVGAALAHNKNKIKEISNSLEFLNDELNKADEINPSFLFKEGESINTFYAVRSLGIDPSSGREMFLTRNGERTFEWNAEDKVPCGVLSPKYNGRLYTNFRFRNWSLNMNFSYYWGGQMYNSTLIDKVENINPYQNADRRARYDRWSEPGQNAFFRGVKERDKTKATSRFVMDDNTFSMKNLKVSYDFETGWMKRIGMEYLTVSASTEDLFVISSIKQERGTYYPFARKFFLSLTARF